MELNVLIEESIADFKKYGKDGNAASILTNS